MLSNKGDKDVRSIMGEKDNMSNKSFKKLVDGLNDTASMKSFTSRKSESVGNDYDASSVKSIKSMKSELSRLVYCAPHLSKTLRENIPEEQDSQLNESYEKSYKTEQTDPGQRLRKEARLLASQLAPICDRLGRLLIDLAPLLAIMGSGNQYEEISSQLNYSMATLEGSLCSRVAARLRGGDPAGTTEATYYQVPVMLTPAEISILDRMASEHH